MVNATLTFTELSCDGLYLAARANVPAEASHMADHVLSMPNSTCLLAFWYMENSYWDFSLLATHIQHVDPKPNYEAPLRLA